jgi:hypothetical protein
MTRTTLLALALLAPTLAQAKELLPTTVTSNSVEKDAEKGIIYEAAHMLTDKVGEYWNEAEGNAGLGKYFEVVFNDKVEVAKVRIWPGVFLDEEFWGRHNRIKMLEFKYPDFTSEKFELEDKMEPQWLTLAEPKTLDKVKVYLRGVYDGSTWNATTVTKIQFFDKGGPDDQPVEVKATSGSSVYDDDKDYGADKAFDGWLDTWWVEGGDTGDGEWVQAAFDAPKTLRRFSISAGFDQTESFFAGSNRAGKVTLTFSDGSSKDFTLADKAGPQEFELGGVTTSSVRATFGKIIKGKTANDLYIGDIRFWE